jgi:hypothetical protein
MTTNNPYEISFEQAESIKDLVGKTLCGNGNEIKILEWAGQNYKLQMPNGDIKETPCVWVLQNVRLGKITVK